MASLSTKVKLYCEANSKVADFGTNVTLQNDSDGKAAYGDIGDQLDEIYKDIDAWKTRIKAVKDANPKE